MYTIFVNPSCCGGRGLDKWNKIKSLLPGCPESIILNGKDPGEDIRNQYARGIRDFAAAGGDGTVNLLLNTLLNSFTNQELEGISLGAIGTGSSNDFHKPINECFLISGVHSRINFSKAEFRDVGRISYLTEGNWQKKYFLINASIGITAEANYLFNNPDKQLGYLKKKNTSVSILYAAMKTIMKYHNFPAVIKSDGFFIKTDLTNLGIVKNRFFSGSLRYNCSTNYSDGLFNIFLFGNMSIPERVRLLKTLSSSDPIVRYQPKGKHWLARGLQIISETKFNLEYDGEIIETNNAVFSILPKYLKVCTC